MSTHACPQHGCTWLHMHAMCGGAERSPSTNQPVQQQVLPRAQTRMRTPTPSNVHCARTNAVLRGPLDRYLDGVIGAERFSEKPDEDKLAELDLLRKYLTEAAEAVDKWVLEGGLKGVWRGWQRGWLRE